MLLSAGNDQIIYVTAAAAAILVVLVVIAFVRRKYSTVAASSAAEVQQTIEDVDPANEGPPRRILPSFAQVRRVGGSRTVRSRLHNRTLDQRTSNDAATPIHDDDYEGSGGDDDDADSELAEFPRSDVKIGVKKRKKLEMKAEKKASREQELHEREERKKRQELLDEHRRKDEEIARLEEAKKVELERLQKEEQERREVEEYKKMKESFAVESEGFDHDIDEDDAEDLLKQFITHIKEKKVVYLEDLASSFRLKTQEAIDRVTALMKSGDLTGVIDDRGKFIYISMEELESVAKFIKQRGRVTITDLAECSNQLINMNPSSKSIATDNVPATVPNCERNSIVIK